MTAELPTPAGPPLHEPETLGSVAARRTKYTIAIAIACALFALAGRATLPPLLGIVPPGIAADGIGMSILSIVLFFLVLVLAITLAMIITHPDTPHTGLFCAFFGISALALRAGPITLPVQLTFLRTGQLLFGDTASLFHRLAIESVLEVALAALANLVALRLHRHFFRNAAWLHRLGSSTQTADRLARDPSFNSPTVHAALENPQRSTAAEHWISAGGALAITTGIAFIVLTITLRNQLPGQALFSCLIAFAAGGFFAQQIFPRTPAWIVWIAPSILAAIVFSLASADPRYPGQVFLAPARALPLDYLATGIPGAVFGYYASLKWQIHQIVHES